MEDAVTDELSKAESKLPLRESVYSQNRPYHDNILRGNSVYTEDRYSFTGQHQMFQTEHEQPDNHLQVTAMQPQPLSFHEGIHEKYRQTDVDGNSLSSNGKTKYNVLITFRVIKS